VGARAAQSRRGAGVPHAEIDRQFLDSTAIRTQLGWAPRMSLDDGLRRAWDGYLTRLG
jgi:nucleoside-diphosphate-sugar epimerase